MNLNFRRGQALTLIFLFLFIGQSQAQHLINEKDCWVCKDGKHVDEHPYKDLSFKTELPYILTGAATLGAAFLTANINDDQPTAEIIAGLDPSTINGFDRPATTYNSPSSATLSDYFRTGATFIPIFFLTNHHTREDIGSLLVLTSEVMATTSGITFMAKNLFPRYRPFIYNSEFTLEEKQKRSSNKSFFSGHTSHTAAFTFLIAKVYHDYHPNSKNGMKVLVWTFSAAIPAVTAYLRVRAGKHFPTDVITGYLVGATTGVLIPHLHKEGLMEGEEYSIKLGYVGSGLGIKVNF